MHKIPYTSTHPFIHPSVRLALHASSYAFPFSLSLLLLLLPFFSTKVQGGEHSTIKSNKRPFPLLSFLSFLGTSLSLLREERGATVRSFPSPFLYHTWFGSSSYIPLSTAGKGFVETRTSPSWEREQDVQLCPVLSTRN